MAIAPSRRRDLSYIIIESRKSFLDIEEARNEAIKYTCKAVVNKRVAI